VAKHNIVELVDGGQASQFMLTDTCDVMFMDIEMPVMNGDKVVKEHRPKFPVIAMTGNVGNDAYFLQVGFHSMLTKPFMLPELKSALEASVGVDVGVNEN
jgi:CheY-like chemotaxis protein